MKIVTGVSTGTSTDGAEKAAGHGAESDASTSMGSDFDSDDGSGNFDSDDGSGPNKARRSTAGNEPETSPLSVSDDSDGAESVYSCPSRRRCF
jgi:hypothetical protein